MKNFSFLALVLGLVAAVAAGPLAAQSGPDISGITGGLTDAGAAIASVGAGMVTVAGAGIAFKWLLGFVFR